MVNDLKKYLSENKYPGRGIICGVTKDAKSFVTAYFIMGRSENSRNRIFEKTSDGIKTKAFDPTKMEDPSLIIYSPVRMYKDNLIITNGDQTDTIYNGLKDKIPFEQILINRKFEPDAPHYTPRISTLIIPGNDSYSFYMSILKSDNGREAQCIRNTFYYDNPIPGEGRFIHTYEKDGEPLMSFEGEPRLINIASNDLDGFSDYLWDSLNVDNKISLYVRFTSIRSNEYIEKIINKNS